MVNYKNILFGTVLLLLLSTSIQAIPTLDIDFRTWSGADGKASHTVGNVTARAIAAIPRQGARMGDTGRVGSRLHQDATGGLGIESSNCGINDTTIDSCEALRLDFDWGAPSSNYYVTGVWVTGLFAAPQGSTRQGERGRVRLIELNLPGPEDNVILFDKTFFGVSSDQTDGSQFIDLMGAFRPDVITFASPGWVIADDFTVVGLTIKVYEPGSLGLFGIGLLAIGIVRRLRRDA